MGDSVEFCGGTHSKNTKDIELVLVSREEAIASGTTSNRWMAVPTTDVVGGNCQST